jgi:sterol desaturase/sphingolipid hydroxylase (fatty acid hydroxylase superfamily)
VTTRSLMKSIRRAVSTISYFGEMFLAPLVAVVLFCISRQIFASAVMAALAGLITWTLAEYTFHRFVLHDMVPQRHGLHHAKPHERVLSIFWQIWACFALVYLVAGGAFVAGALVAYAWYLFVHHCTHHNNDLLPAYVVKNHTGHHKIATRNYGVTTPLWDHVFGTALR